MFDVQRKRLLSAPDEAHDAYYQTEPFTGPSAYFHLKSLEASSRQDFEQFAELSYATLAAWGMHRMGPGGAKMRNFDDFRASLLNVWPSAMCLQKKLPGNLTANEWNALKTIFCQIQCMASHTSLVGNSKVMAHLLPNLIPPVDRQHTLRFLFKKGTIKNEIELEWRTLQQILKEFFYPILESQEFRTRAKQWLADSRWARWDTSELKIVDNLIVGFVRMSRRRQRRKRAKAS